MTTCTKRLTTVLQKVVAYNMVNNSISFVLKAYKIVAAAILFQLTLSHVTDYSYCLTHLECDHLGTQHCELMCQKA